MRRSAAIGILKRRYSTFATLCFGLAESNVTHLGIGEERIRDLPAYGRAVSSGKVVAQDAEIVESDVGELGLAGHFTVCPNAFRSGLQLFVHFDEAAIGQFNARQVQADAFRVGDTSRRYQKVRNVDRSTLAALGVANGDTFA